MKIFEAIILGLIQGLTEFLPISSSGHLIIVPNLLGWETSPLFFDTTLHLGTALALIVFFFKDLWEISLSFIKDVWTKEDSFKDFSDNGKIGLFILLGSIPAAVVGFFFEGIFETVFRDVFYVILFLIAGSVLMFLAERLGKWKEEKEVGFLSSLMIGLFQTLALFPGVSRSGSTISGGMLFGLSREKAAKFSFLLSVPIVVAAGGYKLLTSIDLLSTVSIPVLITGFLASFVSGMFAISFMLRFLKKKGLHIFVFYRILLALILLLII